MLNHFGVHLIAPLSSRLNQHWLVESGREHLVLRRWWQASDEVAYEVDLVKRIAALGWPVASVVAGPIEHDGAWWSLAPFLPGEPRSDTYAIHEQRERGRLLAEFHADLARLGDVGQRGQWRRCEEILADPLIEQTLADHEQTQPNEVRVLRWHLDRARERIVGLYLHDRPSSIVHGDFTPWNLLFMDGRLSGILDFELAHRNHRIADFALAWRGKYDDVIHAYNEVSPLEPEEWALLTPMWWAWLIDGAYQYMRDGIRDDGWTIKQLLRRSPLMGADAVELR